MSSKRGINSLATIEAGTMVFCGLGGGEVHTVLKV